VKTKILNSAAPRTLALEVVIVESPQHLQRRLDPDTGLALLAP
jgi:predicted DNA-binding protein with PD1-like motif